MILQNITNYPNQETTIILNNGEEVKINIVYKIRINNWVMNISYKDFNINNINVVSSCDNLLSQFENILPFSIKINTNNGFSPYFLDDFVNGNNNIELIDNS